MSGPELALPWNESCAYGIRIAMQPLALTESLWQLCYLFYKVSLVASD